MVVFFDEQMYGECQGCAHLYNENYTGFNCEVVEGREETWQCPELQGILHSNEVPVPKKFRMKSWP